MVNARRLRAVVFDFDGTLARPALDFPLMKRRIAELSGRYLDRPADPGPLPALEWIESLCSVLGRDAATAFRLDAHALIKEMEREAAARTSLFEFVLPALARLRGLDVATAVITRNTRQSVQAVFPDAMRHVAAVLTREDVDAVKPDPSHLLAALAEMGVTPAQAIMVGDHPTDVLTARRAGTYAGAVASGGTSWEELERSVPDLLARDAGELLDRLEAEGWFG